MRSRCIQTLYECKEYFVNIKKNRWSDKVQIKKWRKEITIGTIVSLIVGLIGLYSSVTGEGLLELLKPRRMTGDFRIAVAGFVVEGSDSEINLGIDLAENVRNRLEKDIDKIDPDLVIQVWGPKEIGRIKGRTPEDRASHAENLAEKYNANIIVYGIVDTSKKIWYFSPTFYVSALNYYEAQEIMGPHELGSTLTLGHIEDFALIEVGSQLSTRIRALSQVVIGLVYISVNRYEDAINLFQEAEKIPDWPDEQGKEVLYLLIGNAAIKSSQMDMAQVNYEKALSLNPDYSRPYIGLGSVAYRRAIWLFEQTGELSDIETELIDISIQNYEKAMQVGYHPPLSDIETKVHFGFGQCYLMKWIAGQEKWRNSAEEEFKIVINDYDSGSNPRLHELAAESHARLGLIYDLSNNWTQSIKEYEQAILLLDTNPQRQQLYIKRLENLQKKSDTLQD